MTTATPARLDFRATGVADEGCADTMSTESTCSVALCLSVLKSTLWLPPTISRDLWRLFAALEIEDREQVLRG